MTNKQIKHKRGSRKGALKRRRRSFTLKYKLSVLNYLEKNGNNIHGTARQYRLHRACVRGWKKNKTKIQNTMSKRKSLLIFWLKFWRLKLLKLSEMPTFS